MVDVHELARKVASELGKDWRAEPGYQVSHVDAFVRTSAGEGLHLIEGWNAKGKITISGEHGLRQSLSQFWPRAGAESSINVSTTKTPERIARDIERRILSDYRAALAKAQENKATDEREKAEQSRLMAEVIAALGSLKGRRLQHGPDTVDFGSWGDDGKPHGDLTIYQAARSVKCSVTMPKALVLDFARMLASL